MALKKKKKSSAKPAKKRGIAAKRSAKSARGKKAVKKSAAKRATTRKTKPAIRKSAGKAKVTRKEVLGEGNYTASRNFRKSETAFVQRNKSRIPALGKAAEAALEGPEGKDLLAAEADARAHSHAPGAED